MERRELGKYIVADPEICHGKPTFRGTRITVRRILEMVADGKDWETIGEEWDGVVSKKAIAEALLVAARTLVKHENRRPSWLDDEDCNWLEDESLEWPEVNSLGQYVVANPRVCHGQVTFRGTRIFVKDALEMAAEGIDWDEINRQWHNRVSKEAMAEAIRVAARALDEHETAHVVESEQALEMISQ
jgi:uncharacterized protein (DUF433 family)